jgi:Fic family protein
VQFFLQAVAETADSATKCGRHIIMLKERLTQEIQQKLKGKSYGIKMLEYLFEHPVIQINELKPLLSISYPTAKSLVECFCEMQILDSVDKRRSRNKKYQFSQYMKLLSEGTE